MNKIKSLEDLGNLKKEIQANLDRQKQGNFSGGKVEIKVAMATCGIASGAKTIMDYLREELEKRNIDAILTPTGCMCYCYAEPTIEVTLPGRDPVVYGFVDTRKADEIIEKYIKNQLFVEGIIPKNYLSID